MSKIQVIPMKGNLKLKISLNGTIFSSAYLSSDSDSFINKNDVKLIDSRNETIVKNVFPPNSNFINSLSSLALDYVKSNYTGKGFSTTFLEYLKNKKVYGQDSLNSFYKELNKIGVSKGDSNMLTHRSNRVAALQLKIQEGTLLFSPFCWHEGEMSEGWVTDSKSKSKSFKMSDYLKAKEYVYKVLVDGELETKGFFGNLFG